MDSDYIQQIRYRLEKRLCRLQAAPVKNFHWALKRTLDFVQENEITNGILADLELCYPKAKQYGQRTANGGLITGPTEAENAAICYSVIKACAAKADSAIELRIGGRIADAPKAPDQVAAYRITFVEPLFDYIEEQIDDKRVILALLKKFKHRCEWFRRADLFSKFKDDTGKGEKTLARDFYEYLHDQGVQFHIEPESASDRIDLISGQSGKDRLVADAKLFNPERSQDRSYIAKGFRQIYDYTKDYNEPFGYLVIFKTCEQDLSIPTPYQESAVPFVTHNNKTIFLLVIDIFDYPESASKRGRLQAYEITPEQLVESLE